MQLLHHLLILLVACELLVNLQVNFLTCLVELLEFLLDASLVLRSEAFVGAALELLARLRILGLLEFLSGVLLGEALLDEVDL